MIQLQNSILNSATIDGQPLVLEYTPMQEQVFLKSNGKHIIVPAGRRCGKTFGAAQYCIDICLDPEESYKIIWCDTSYGQIKTNYTDYFEPLLKKLNKAIYDVGPQKREINILNSSISFRSSDEPDLLVGRGYRLCIVNEAGIQLFNYPNLWYQYLSPMLLDYSDSRAIFIGTPRGTIGRDGKDSIYYNMYKKGLIPDQTEYQSFHYTSYDNPKLSTDQIAALEAETPDRLKAQEIRAEFLNANDLQIFNPAWWVYVDSLPAPSSVMKTFISIDTAYGVKTVNDESALTVWLKDFGGTFYCVDCWHDRKDFPSLVEKIKCYIDIYKPDNVVIESKASGQSLIQTLKRDLPKLPVTPFIPQGDKVDRAVAITSYISSGRVKLLKAPWNNDLVNQATVFPLGTHDDICFIAGTKIATKTGNINIENICIGDIVITPIGLKKVLKTYKSISNKTIKKFGLEATENHPIFSNNEFKQINILKNNDPVSILNIWNLIKWYLKEKLTIVESPTKKLVGKDSITTIAHITQQQSIILLVIELLKRYIELYGKNLTTTKRSLLVLKYTTKIIIEITIILKIYSYYLYQNIADSVKENVQKTKRTISLKLDLLLKNGTHLKKVSCGIVKTPEEKKKKIKNLYVLNAIQSSYHLVKTLNSAVTTVAKNGIIETTQKLLKIFVKNAINYLLQNIEEKELLFSAQSPAELNTTVLEQNVYNIEVEDANCYYANNILVGNCDSMSMALLYAKMFGAISKANIVTREITPAKPITGFTSYSNNKLQGFNPIHKDIRLKGYR